MIQFNGIGPLKNFSPFLCFGGRGDGFGKFCLTEVFGSLRLLRFKEVTYYIIFKIYIRYKTVRVCADDQVKLHERTGYLFTGAQV